MEIPLETYKLLMKVISSRRYKLTIKVYEVSPAEAARTMEFIRATQELCYLYYVLMYYGGVRVRHAVRLIESFRPEEEVFIEMLGDYAQRLTCYDSFCRYYLGVKGGKPCEWVYFPKELLKLLNKYEGIKRDEKAITRHAIRHNLLRPKYLRKINWRYCVKTIKDKDVCRFIQSRLGELKVSETRYGDLLEEADQEYPKLVDMLNSLIKG